MLTIKHRFRSKFFRGSQLSYTTYAVNMFLGRLCYTVANEWAVVVCANENMRLAQS